MPPPSAARNGIRRCASLARRSTRQKQKIPWMKSFPSYYPAVAAGRVKAPTPTLQGATDRQVPADQADKLARAEARRAPVMMPRSERSWRTP